jgi:hypothetical protein
MLAPLEPPEQLEDRELSDQDRRVALFTRSDAHAGVTRDDERLVSHRLGAPRQGPGRHARSMTSRLVHRRRESIGEMSEEAWIAGRIDQRSTALLIADVDPCDRRVVGRARSVE